MNIIEKYNKPFEYFSAFMYLLLAYQYFALWSQPNNYQISRIIDFSILIIFEFIMVHSGVFMSAIPKKTSLLALVPFYGVFVLAFNATTSDNNLMILYGIITFNRMRFAFADVSDQLKLNNIMFSVLSAVIYILLLFATLIGQDLIPKLGLTKDFLEYSAYLDHTSARGEFIEKPHISLAMGMFYNISIALLEIYLVNRTFKNSNIKLEDFKLRKRSY